MPKVKIADRTIHYWTGRIKQPVAGHGILLLHGAGGNGLGWFMQKQLLGRERFLLAPDLPAHGRSTGKPPESIEEHVPFVLGLLDALGLKTVDVVGHSMGGAIALALTLAQPKRVRRLVLIGSGARLPVPDAAVDLVRRDPEEALDALIEWIFTPLAPQEFVRNVMDQMDFACALPDFLACRRFDVSARLGEIAAQAAVIVGADDRLTPPALSRELAAGIQGAVYHEIEGAGHLPMLEKADAVNAVLADFLLKN
jgi:pimeloyl-ACP methyl ester carboxylesterase